jgi:integral membrane sensor domain MASE1
VGASIGTFVGAFVGTCWERYSEHYRADRRYVDGCRYLLGGIVGCPLVGASIGTFVGLVMGFVGTCR